MKLPVDRSLMAPGELGPLCAVVSCGEEAQNGRD